MCRLFGRLLLVGGVAVVVSLLCLPELVASAGTVTCPTTTTSLTSTAASCITDAQVSSDMQTVVGPALGGLVLVVSAGLVGVGLLVDWAHRAVRSS